MHAGEQLLLPFETPPVLSPENFCTSHSNQEAFSWIGRWHSWPQRSLVVYGPAGCGKTHLGHVWQRQVGAAWLTLEKKKTATPFEAMAQNRFWIIDQAPPFEDELFLLQLYNMIQEQAGGLLLLAPTPPARWPLHLPDLRSRLCAVPTVEIFQPDDQLLQQVLRKLFDDQQVRVTEEVIAFLERHMERSFAGAQRLVEKINQKSLRSHRPVTVPFLREIGAHLPSFLA